MTVDIEAIVVAHLSERLPGVTVCADVPEHKPEKLVTIERTGGRAENQLDHPRVAVQSWATRRYVASALSADVDRAMLDLPYGHPDVMGCTRESLYDWPDPDSRMPRYQGIYQITSTL